ncbi:MAG: protein kinase, partial [Bradymonadaceae bacterium]
KALELFEREVETLASLDHPQIPRFLDTFRRRGREGRPPVFCLVQEYVAGRDLAAAIAGGEVWRESEVVALLDQLLGVVAYLHGHSPPIVHRDIKPDNLIRRDGAPLALVDLGAVQVASPQTIGGSTIVGTSGYLPVEQLMGR